MSVFQCENCGCAENTALSFQGFNGVFEDEFDWEYAPERRGKKLCSLCGPTLFSDGTASDKGVWHNRFPYRLLPKGKFFTNSQGNLEHIETGETDYVKYTLNPVPPQEPLEL